MQSGAQAAGAPAANAPLGPLLIERSCGKRGYLLMGVLLGLLLSSQIALHSSASGRPPDQLHPTPMAIAQRTAVAQEAARLQAQAAMIEHRRREGLELRLSQLASEVQAIRLMPSEPPAMLRRPPPTVQSTEQLPRGGYPLASHDQTHVRAQSPSSS